MTDGSSSRRSCTTSAPGRSGARRHRRASRASNPEVADPFPAIVDFKRQLDALGIDLVVVPVPPKAVIYPDYLLDLAIPPGGTLPRLDVNLQEFYRRLAAEGVKVLDLVPLLVEHRLDAAGTVFCKEDSHWSPRATALAARWIASAVPNRPWLQEIPRESFAMRPALLSLEGDLRGFLDGAGPAERLPSFRVGHLGPGGLAPVEPSRTSPVLLLGDSNALVFHVGGDPRDAGSGLPDHLAREFGFPMDLVAVRGSGATAARVSLLRRNDGLEGKRLVIWCFAARLFTESPEGWARVPLTGAKPSR